MRSVAILIAASPREAFYSQIAAFCLALRALRWQRWRPSVHVYFSGDPAVSQHDDWTRWAEHLRDVNVHVVPREAFVREGNWAQVDATLAAAPREAEVLISMDADTLPAAGFEDVLDRVADEDLIAGVMAHYPPPGVASQTDWERIATSSIGQRLVFDHAYSLTESGDRIMVGAPFYVNGGVVFYGRSSFNRLVPLYLTLRKQLTMRLTNASFAGQVATTLAATEAGLRTLALPIRYNFPNDPIAERLHPRDAQNIAVHHYLRVDQFDRHKIFASGAAFDQFLSRTLDGPNLRFQGEVRRICGATYPFN